MEVKESNKGFKQEYGNFEVRTRLYPLSHKYVTFPLKSTTERALDELWKRMQEVAAKARKTRPTKLGSTQLNASLVYICKDGNNHNNRTIIKLWAVFEGDKPEWRIIYSLRGFKELFEHKYMQHLVEAPKEEPKAPVLAPCSLCKVHPVAEITKSRAKIACPVCGAVKFGDNYDAAVDAWNETEGAKDVNRLRDPIAVMCDRVKMMLMEKNRKYGNSALDPKRVFSKADPIEQLKVRIDDKLSRIQSGQVDEDEDVYMDLTGYLILLMIAKEENARKSQEDKA